MSFSKSTLDPNLMCFLAISRKYYIFKERDKAIAMYCLCSDMTALP